MAVGRRTACTITHSCAECCLSFSRPPAFFQIPSGYRNSVASTETRVARHLLASTGSRLKRNPHTTRQLGCAAAISDHSHRRLTVRAFATLRPQPSKRVFGPRFGTGFEPVTARVQSGALPTELTSIDTSPDQNPLAERPPPTAPFGDRAARAAGRGRHRCFRKDAGGNRTHLKPGCSRLPGHWAPASSILVRNRT
jgi:hypothetical protein